VTVDVDGLLDEAITALETGEITTCETNTTEVLNVLLPGDSRIPEALALRGTVRMRYDQSAGLKDLREAVRLDTSEPQLQMLLGEALLAENEAGEAENYLSRAFRLSRGHPAAANAYGRCLIRLGKAFQAVQTLGPLVERGNAPATIVRLYADAQFESGDVSSARDVIIQLYGSDGAQTPEEQLQLIEFDLSLGNIGAAREAVETLLNKNSKSVNARLSVIRVMEKSGDTAGLQEHISVLASLDTDRPDALAMLIKHSETLSDIQLDAALYRYQSADRMTEELADLGYALGLWFDRTKAYDRAWDVAGDVNSRIATYRGSTQTPQRRAEELRSQNRRLEQAIRLFEETPQPGAEAQECRYIYLTGAPCTGSPVIQSVLTAQSEVVSSGDRSALYAYLRDATERNMSAPGFAGLASQLAVAETARLTRLEKQARVIVDKTPEHAYIAGLLARVHSGSKFVNTFRNAGDTALSIYLRPFSRRFGEATDIEAIAANLEFRLLAHKRWVEAGLEIFPLSYEAFAQERGRLGRELNDLTGMVWSEKYLECAPQINMTTEVTSSGANQGKWKAYQSFAPDVFARLADISAAQNMVIDSKNS
jgi:tetratricopeptide (TPR) repeat protein